MIARPTRHRPARAAASAFALIAAAIGTAPVAQAQPVSILDSFRIGDAGVLCTAQIAPADRRLEGLFDRAYRLACRDAAGSVGSVIALRRSVDPAAADIGMGGTALQCAAPVEASLDHIGPVSSLTCRDAERQVDYRRYLVTRGDTSYLAEGLAGYDPALRLALASIVTDRRQPGEVKVASTEITDSVAFARIQAGELDPAAARAEAYARNNDGRFAEASAFFEQLAARTDNQSNAELLANSALQQSNLGNFTAAYSLLLQAEKVTAQRDGVTRRLVRNYRAINLLNQRFADAAIEILDAPAKDASLEYDVTSVRQGLVSEPLAEQINRENEGLARLGGVMSVLKQSEREAILDAQASQLRGLALLQKGQLDASLKALSKADSMLQAVRGGRVTSANWLRSQIAMDRAAIAEAQGDMDSAAGQYASAVDILRKTYPQTPLLLAAQARQAAFLGRSGKPVEAMALFATVVEASEQVPDSSSALRDLLGPYYALLVESGAADAPAALFRAAQSLQRPGLARTQAVLARELSEGDDEASALFRLSVARLREIGRTEVEIAQLGAAEDPSDADRQRLAAARETLQALRAEQTALTARLAQYPRYKVLSPTTVSLAELQQALKPGDAYYKLMIVGEEAFALLADQQDAKIFRVADNRKQLEQKVAQIRDSIVVIENGEVQTYPFDIALSRELYASLFGPVADRMTPVKHLIFEPDGPLLQLPPAVLVMDDESVERYKARIAKPNADEFDFTGTNWLGRDRMTSISVSPRAFLDVRTIAPSRASKAYLGLGSNAKPAAMPATAPMDDCSWPLATWQDPIDPGELKLGQSIMGASRSQIMTGEAFTDTALLKSDSLDDYRILHFATHGLVTAPRPECPARPALVTSFGEGDSDGLLSFREVFDLRLDADLVVLSACDTAGMATAAASREAGVPTGGNYALDGLVRAFVGAGARSVIASHWPVPDDYDATKTLISGLFTAKQGQSIGQLLDDASVKLMNVKETSHPFYWAAFIVLGDGDKPLLRPGRMAGEAGNGRQVAAAAR